MGGSLARRSAEDWQYLQRERKILDGLAAAQWFVAEIQKKLAIHRGELRRMKLADITASTDTP